MHSRPWFDSTAVAVVAAVDGVEGEIHSWTFENWLPEHRSTWSSTWHWKVCLKVFAVVDWPCVFVVVVVVENGGVVVDEGEIVLARVVVDAAYSADYCCRTGAFVRPKDCLENSFHSIVVGCPSSIETATSQPFHCPAYH